MQLDDYMKAHDFTDKSFGERIGKSRIQVYRYRHGMQIPGREAINKIFQITEGHVPPASFYPSNQSP